MAETEELPVAEITADVVCRTNGCPSEGIPFRVQLAENIDPPKYRAHCVGCDTPITDITEVTDG